MPALEPLAHAGIGDDLVAVLLPRGRGREIAQAQVEGEGGRHAPRVLGIEFILIHGIAALDSSASGEGGAGAVKVVGRVDLADGTQQHGH